MVVAKAYADWVTRSPELKGASQFINDPPALYAAGIEPVYVPTRLPLGSPSSLTARTTRVKNSVDVKMTADCIECAHSYPNIGIYVLVSGDSDFIHVINSLRAIGKRAIIIGVSWSTSRRLADQVDGLILYDTDVDPETHHEPARVESVPAAARAGAADGRQQLSEVMRVIEDIVRAERQAGRTPLLTSLKQRIMRRVPGFDEKKLGFSGFKKLMLRTVQEGNIKLVTVGLVDWVIMADEPTPQEALPDSRASGGAIESVAAEEEVLPTAEAKPDSGRADAPADDREGDATTIAATDAPAGAPADTEAEDELEPEPAAEAAEAEASAPAADPLPPLSPELEQALAETLSRLELPDGPGDGLDGRRVTDLIIMADSLEHREGVSHVAFNFLIGEVCDALREGLKAEHIEITHRWGGGIFSRTYVNRLVRSLSSGDIFVRGWHSDRDGETGRTRRRRTFNLNHAHPLVEQAIKSQWGIEAGTDTDTYADTHATDSVAAPEVDDAVTHATDSAAISTAPSEMDGADTQAADSAAPPEVDGTDTQAADSVAISAASSEMDGADSLPELSPEPVEPAFDAEANTAVSDLAAVSPDAVSVGEGTAEAADDPDTDIDTDADAHTGIDAETEAGADPDGVDRKETEPASAVDRVMRLFRG